jgi:hypothetical protein
MQSVHVYLLRRRKTAITIAVYAFCAYSFWLLTETALPTVLLTYGIVLALLLPWGLRFQEGICKVATMKRRAAGKEPLG